MYLQLHFYQYTFFLVQTNLETTLSPLFTSGERVLYNTKEELKFMRSILKIKQDAPVYEE